MKSLLALAAFAVASSTIALPAVAAESRYSSLGDKSCRLDKAASRKIQRHEDFDPMLYRCSGGGGHTVSITYHGLYVRVSIGSKGKLLDVFTPYDAGPKIEWRGPKGAATAAILRLSARGNRPVPDSVLAVLKLTPERDCLVAIIDTAANPEPNELARQTADNIDAASCEKPEVVGKSSEAATEILSFNVAR
ncbi:hypothetical protein PY365_28815 [Roseiarcaceae bacterium H3SJ34-1]|uniref:hypothetical protein n=1 Tax=Terripilifer ovatus TaxID=3032367 RepID=UPI003AB92D72|nr:hypothetical protein [Roseiarcaceae bacterium H3SJ34-1]